MTGWPAVVSAVAASTAIAVVARAGHRCWSGATAVALTAVTVSWAVTAAGSRPPQDRAPAWTPALVPMLIEWCAFAALIVLFLRRAPARPATLVCAAATVAMSALVLRLTGVPSWQAAVQACALWTLTAVPSTALGLLLRHQAGRRRHAVAEARRGQRLQLARDLHDFVAHEVSEMIAIAQAGHVVDPADPARATALFQRIEDAGQRAMSSLDRTVRMLADTDAGPGLADLPDLVLRFGAAGPVRASLDLDPAIVDEAPPEVGTVAYRAVAEALTNVRRHAPTASTVAVSVRRTDADRLTVAVTNAHPAAVPPAREPRRGGRGLRGLRVLAEAAGGRLRYGRHDDGWRVAVELPFSSTSDDAPISRDRAMA
ncbi:histidine kinase [Micromonosporaceae bacterium B7E4]